MLYLLKKHFKRRHLMALLVLSIITWTLVSFLSISSLTTIDKQNYQFNNLKHELNKAVQFREKNIVQNDDVNLNELYHIGECLLEQAGEKIVDIRQKMDSAKTDFKRKVDKSIVTEADMESHNIIVHSLQYKYKFLRIISEEDGQLDTSYVPEAIKTLHKCDNYTPQKTDAVFNAADLKVWIDPLDATQEYSGADN